MRFLIFSWMLLSLSGFAQNSARGTIKVKKPLPVPKDTVKLFIPPTYSTGIISFGTNFKFNNDTTMPQYIGGEDAMKAFIYSKIKYPENSKYKGISAECNLNFTVNVDGTLSDIVVSWGVAGCKECDEEAIRIFKQMDQWKPATYKPTGKNVKRRASANMRFTFLK